MSRRKEISPHREPSGGKTDQTDPGTVEDCNGDKRDNNPDTSNYNRNSRVCLQNMPPEERVRRRVRGTSEPENPFSVAGENSELISRANISTLAESGNAGPNTAPRFAEEASNLVCGANTTVTHSTVTTSPTSVSIRTKRNNLAPNALDNPTSVSFRTKRNHTYQQDTTSPATMNFGTQINHTNPIGANSPTDTHRNHSKPHDTYSPTSLKSDPQRNHIDQHSTYSPATTNTGTERNHSNPRSTYNPASMTFGTQINSACTQRNTDDNTTLKEVESNPTDTNSNDPNPANASAVVALKSPEQGDDSSASMTGGQQKKVEKKPDADDDSESREFFLSQICCSGRVRRCLLMPCRHVVCFICKRQLSACPFCRTPTENCIKIRYSFDNKQK